MAQDSITIHIGLRPMGHLFKQSSITDGGLKNMKLEDRVAIVNGASTGIGLAIAENFAGEGARVALAAMSANRVERASQAIVEKFGVSMAISADVSNDNPPRRLKWNTFGLSDSED